MREYRFYFYLLASDSRVLCAGLTNNLQWRVLEHKGKEKDGFTKRYRVNRLVFFETFHDVRAALAREKQVKAWRRERKRWR